MDLSAHTSRLSVLLETRNSVPPQNYIKLLETSLLDELIASAISRFQLLEIQGERHHEMAVFEEEYDFEENQRQLEQSYRKAIEAAEKIIELCRSFESPGCKVSGLSQLQGKILHFRRIFENDESFYDSEEYKKLTERAYRDIQSGNLEDWPT